MDIRHSNTCIGFDFLREYFDVCLAFDGLAFVNRQPAVILQEIRKLEFGNAEHMGFERTAN